jgi:hypothetical protein
MKKELTCPYCGSHAELKDAFVIYHKLGFGQVYVCANYPACDAYVGVHEGTVKPKGSLASSALRALRKQAHGVIDPLWREQGLQRKAVYEAAALVLGRKEFHIGDFKEEDAKKFLENAKSIVDGVKSIVLEKQRIQVESQANQNLIKVLTYLYVRSQQRPKTILSARAYKGHNETFAAAIEANLVKKIQARETKKSYFVLTPFGQKSLGI